MGLRSQKRHIAKVRMKIIGINRINRRMKEKNADGVSNWKVALMDEKAHMAQIAYSLRRRRKLKKVSA